MTDTPTVQQAGMASSMEPVQTTSSLSERRPAAMGLPNMSLPPLPAFQMLPTRMTSFNAPFGSAQPYQTANHQTNIGNLLTPPTTLAGENLTPITSLLQEGSNVTPAMAAQAQTIPPLNPGWLSQPGSTPLSMPAGNTPQWPNHMRGLFSPSLLSSLPRTSSSSPGTTETLPPPPMFDFSNAPPYPSSSSMSAPSSIPAPTVQQHAAAQNYIAQAAQAQAQSQTPVSASTTHASPTTGSDIYSQRPQSTPTTYQAAPPLYSFASSASQPASAQQSNFPFSSSSPPAQESPASAPLPGTSRFSPSINQNVGFVPPVSQVSPFGFRGFNNSYTMPQLNQAGIHGPLMTNMHNPGTNMAIVGMPGQPMPGGMIPGYHSGVAAQMYGNAQHGPLNDRPFKCNECPQSFNRNHDLKRHKRIHLAVKPFPCGHCDKSFSRKDALKRHILVKGCGKHASKSDRRGEPVKPEDEGDGDDEGEYKTEDENDGDDAGQ